MIACQLPGCDGTFPKGPSENSRKKYCSKECSRAARLAAQQRYNNHARVQIDTGDPVLGVNTPTQPGSLFVMRLEYLLNCERYGCPPMRCLDWRKTAPLSPTPEKETA